MLLPRYCETIIVFDFDGVIVQSPCASPGTQPQNHSCWEEYWLDTASQRPNPEMLFLYKQFEHHPTIDPVILTARPKAVEEATRTVLAGFGIINPILRMREDQDDPSWQGSGIWKRDTIKLWQRLGTTVLLVVEDYKPNADAIREVVPVLLYERMKAID